MDEEIEILRAPDAKLVKELSLVLQSVGIPHRVVGNQHQRWIVVPAERARDALEELSVYHGENVGRRGRERKLAIHGGATTHVLLWAALLCLFHVLAQAHALGVDWRSVGRVDGAGIGHGEVWRSITALSLHADLTHLASNLVFGGLFVALLCQVLGGGPTWLVLLGAGAAGNLVNALVVGSSLRSLGASPAVFAALGALTAVQFLRKLVSARARMARWIPLVAGVLLLGWNGMGSARLDPWDGLTREATDTTDVGAHVAGFACGFLAGFAIYRLLGDEDGSRRTRTVIAWVPPGLFVIAWSLALLST